MSDDKRNPTKGPAIEDDLWTGIPEKFRPMGGDGMTMLQTAALFKAAVQIRHDFQTQAAIAASNRSLGRTNTWESAFARRQQAQGAGGASLADLAQEHKRLEGDTKAGMTSLANPDLAQLLGSRIAFMFPDIGFSAGTGDAVLRMRAPKSVLDNFHPLGVSNPDLVRLLLKPVTSRLAYYW